MPQRVRKLERQVAARIGGVDGERADKNHRLAPVRQCQETLRGALYRLDRVLAGRLADGGLDEALDGPSQHRTVVGELLRLRVVPGVDDGDLVGDAELIDDRAADRLDVLAVPKTDQSIIQDEHNNAAIFSGVGANVGRHFAHPRNQRSVRLGRIELLE